MQKYIALCGKDNIPPICYTYPQNEVNDIVILSVDELMQDIFNNRFDENNVDITIKVRNHIVKKSIEIINAGCAVLLDFGFCSVKCRERLKYFYQEQDINCQWYYMEFEDSGWHIHIDETNWEQLRTDRKMHKKGFSNVESIFFKQILDGLDIPSEFGVELSLRVERK